MFLIKSLFKIFGKSIFYWGPGVHLHLANMLLQDKDVQEIGDYKIIKNNEERFLYGNISPDITLGKKQIKDIEKHSHTWKTGFKVLNSASSEKEVALGYGYLAHLASDVIAHNFYIPKKLLISRGLRNFLHLVLEIRVDMTLYSDTSELIKKMVDSDFTEEDKYIKKLISKAVLPFGINRKIFEYSLKAVKSRYLYRGLITFTDYENWQLENKNLIKQYHELSYSLIKDIVINKENSTLMNYDPNGEANLSKLKELKKKYQKEIKRGIDKKLYKVPEDLLLIN